MKGRAQSQSKWEKGMTVFVFLEDDSGSREHQMQEGRSGRPSWSLLASNQVKMSDPKQGQVQGSLRDG